MFTYLFGISRRWEMMFLLCSGVLVVYALRVNISVAAPKMAEDLGWSERDKGLVLSAFYWGYAAGQIPASRFAQVYGAKWMFGLSILIPSILTLMVPLACRTSLPLALTVRCLLGFFESASFPAVFHFYPIWIPPKDKTIMITTIHIGMYVGEVIAFSVSGVLCETYLPISGYDFGEWPSVFYLFGIIGILWFPLWAYFAYESPDVHPYITQEERDFIRKSKAYAPLLADDLDSKEFAGATAGSARVLNYSNKSDTVMSYQSTSGANAKSPLHANFINKNNSDLDDVDVDDPSNNVNNYKNREVRSTSVDGYDHLIPSELAKRTPWLKFFTHKESLTLFVMSWSAGFVNFMMLSEMPSYLTNQLGFDIVTSGALCVVPYASLFAVTLGFGKLFDYLQHSKGWEVRTVRQTAQFIAVGGSSIFLLICGFVPENLVWFCYGCMVVAQAIIGVSQAGLGCSYLDLAPRFSPVMCSIGNTIGAIAGIAGPIVVAEFTERYPGSYGWRLVFIVTFVQCCLALVLWRLFQSSDIHPELNTPLPKRD